MHLVQNRNQKFQTTEGYRSAFNQKLPLYSENPSILNGFSYSAYYSPTDEIIGSIKFYSRAINSLTDDDVRVSERLYIPSNSSASVLADPVIPLNFLYPLKKF